MSSGDTIKRHVIATDATVVRSYSRLRLRTITCTLHESAGVFNIKRGLTAIINDKITIVPVRGSRTFQRVRLDRVDRRQTVNSKLSAKGEKKTPTVHVRPQTRNTILFKSLNVFH